MESQVEREANSEESRAAFWTVTFDTIFWDNLLPHIIFKPLVLEANISVYFSIIGVFLFGWFVFYSLYQFMLGDSSPGLSCVSACLLKRDIDCLCSELSFQEFFPRIYGRHLWKMKIVSSSKVKGICLLSSMINISRWRQSSNRLSAHYKVFVCPKLGYISYNITHCVYRCHLALFTVHCGIWGSGKWHKCSDYYYCCKKVLCLWLKSLVSSSSIHKTDRLICCLPVG